ncbi:hypothetical protein [Brevundimonas sp. NPDC058933]|uniref:hypothetical protein n=1 Tax=Brevundimonas sp. NPDC058933 TaxID=3346673 RepID=UPI003BEEC8D3
MDIYPFDLLPPATERWRLSSVALSGGVSPTRAPTLSRTDGGGFWMCWMNEIELITRPQIKAARALEASLDGGVTSIIVPAFDWVFSPETVAHADGSPFEDGSLYLSSPVAATVTAPAALRATILQAMFVGGGPLEAGERFSIIHPTKGKRLYTIARIRDRVADTYTLEIRPPLREAVLAGAEVDVSTPGCVMRLGNPDDFLGAIDALHESVANAIWVEAP